VSGRAGAVSGPAGGPAEADWAGAVAAVTALPLDAPVLLACHVNPDGDALGSMLGAALGLRRRGHTAVQASFPEPFEVAEPFTGLPGLDLLVPPAAAVPEPALFVSFDAASAGRLGPLADHLDRAPVSVVVDHHASNPGFGKINLIDPAAAATAVLAAELLSRLGVPLDRAIAECLYVGLATDTGSFRYDTTTPAVHELAARLVATGIPVGAVSRRLYDTRPYAAVTLYGELLGRTALEPGAAGGRGLVWTYATLADLARYGLRPQVLEPLIDSVRVVAEADVACVCKQLSPDEWSVSLRSRGGTDLSRVAVSLGGGGHRLAAGFTGYGDLDGVLARLRAALAGDPDG
jgi:bifunctional oligoribonuclease and PAP phosphatase NrnA